MDGACKYLILMLPCYACHKWIIYYGNCVSILLVADATDMAFRISKEIPAVRGVHVEPYKHSNTLINTWDVED